MRVADRIVANSPYVAQTIRERYGLRVPYIYSGVDAEYFRRLALDRTAPRGKIRVLFAGSLQPRKHPELVIEAARHWPQADFILMGDGPLKPLLAQQVREEKLVNVSFQSTLAYREYARILVTADIFLFPSRIEGLGKVLMEAAASGIPALVFDDYCTPVIIDGVTGYQVKTFGEMLERLRWLMEDRELRIRMGRAAAEHANRFDWRIIAQQWEKVFEETIFEKAYDT
jgi:glycosyltransferase involved in cell wall biosynthesis